MEATSLNPERIVAAIRADLVTGHLRPGDPLRQDEYAARLDVSRIPLREALSMLTAEGLLVHELYRGYRVATFTRADIQEMLLALRLLETIALEAGIPRLTDEARRTLDGAVSALAEAQDGHAWDFLTAYETFRFTLLEQANMPIITKLIRDVWHLGDAYRLAWLSNVEARSFTLGIHQDVLAAIHAGDIGLVVKLMDEHRESATKAIAASAEGFSEA